MNFKSSKTSKSSISCFSTNFYTFNITNKSLNVIFSKNISSRIFKFIISFLKLFSRTPRFISIWISYFITNIIWMSITKYITISLFNNNISVFITSFKCFYKFFNCHSLFFFKFINNIFNIITRKTSFKSS